MPVDHSKTIIEVEDVSFRYETQPVLEHVTFDIHRGDYLGIIGPNGGGKTTLLKIMLGLLRPDTGIVKYFGTPVARFKAWEKIGYVPQKAVQFDLQFPATVSEVVAMGRTARRGIGRPFGAEDRKKINEALEQVDMLDYQDRRIGELSGGQQQRIFIARALASEPEIIFLDEPTVGVDANAQEQFYLLLKKLNETLGLTLLLVSHDIDVIASQATELAAINGRLVYHGSPQSFDTDELMRQLYSTGIKFIGHDH